MPKSPTSARMQSPSCGRAVRLHRRKPRRCSRRVRSSPPAGTPKQSGTPAWSPCGVSGLSSRRSRPWPTWNGRRHDHEAKQHEGESVMADQFTKGTGQPQTSGFTPQEEEAGAAFGLNAGWAGEMYQATAPTYAPIPNNYAPRGWGWASTHSYLPTPTDTGQRKVVDAFVDLTTMGPDQVGNLQQRLYDAGFYDASYYKRNGPKIHFGSLDDALVSAYSDVIRQSMR